MSTNATCGASFSQLFNSLDQSPCAVAAALGGVCNAGVYLIRALPAGFSYLGPSDANPPTPCTCSSVFYQMLSACAACQSGDFLSWSQYNLNCTAVTIGFAEPLPPGINVPDYAYVQLNATSTFNVPAAEADKGPESSAPPSSQSTATSSATPVSTAPGSTAPGSTAPGSSTQSKSHAGAIAGGVVGGVVGAILVAILIYWFFIRRRHSRSEGASPGLVNLNAEGGPMSPPPMSYAGPSPSNFSAIESPKLYNPSDPSTFPSSPATSAMYTTHSYTDLRPQYSGAPEV